MVDEVVADERFRRADGRAGRRSWPPARQRPTAGSSASLAHAAASDLAGALDFEDRAQAACFASPDHAEAVAAFAEKRVPARFTG